MKIETAVVGDTVPVPARKRPLWRRILRIAGRVLGVLVVLVVLLVVFLHTPWGKSFVRGRIESKLAAKVNGEVKLGSLDYTFMFGEIRLGDLEIRDASGKPAIAITSLTAAIDRGSILDGAPVVDDLRIAGLAVSIVQTADGRSNLTGLFKPSDDKPLKQIRVARLSVTGGATVTKPDGTSIAVTDLDLSGTIDARPLAKEVDVVLGRLGAKVAIAKPGAAVKNLAVAIDSVTLGRRQDAIDVDVKQLVVGALGIESLGAHVKLADGKLRGAQSITIGKAKIDSKQLATLLGKQVLLDDVGLDVTVTGPEDKLAIHGKVRTRRTTLAIDGTVDVSSATPRYKLALVGAGHSEDLTAKQVPQVETDLRIDITGTGMTAADLEAEIALVVGPTKIESDKIVGALAFDGLSAKAMVNRGAYRLDSFEAHGLGFAIAGTGELAADKTMRGRLTIGGSPAEAMKILAAAGIAIPRKVPLLRRLDLAVSASGTLDGALAVEVEPTSIAIARGQISVAGSAKLQNRVLQSATTKIGLHGLDLGALAALAGRPPKLQGSLSGTLDLARDGTNQSARYGLTIGLREPALDVVAKGNANATSATAHADVVRRGDRAVLATLNAQLPLDKQGLLPTGRWHVSVDAARRPLAELAALLPERLRERVPAGDVELHADLKGTPERPGGWIDVKASAEAPAGGTQKLELHANLAPNASGIAVGTKVTIADAAHGTIAIVDGKVALPTLFVGRKPDVKRLRAAAVVDATIDLPDRELASLADLRPKLAELGGSVGGRITVHGSVAKPALDAKLRWHGYGTASGGPGETTLALSGEPTAFTATIVHNEAVTIVADIDRKNPDRIAIHARARAATPLLPLIPKFVAAKLAGNDPGRLQWDMEGTFALARGPAGLALETGDVTGSLDVKGGAIALPHSDRRWHDIDLAIASDARGLQIKSLVLHETDLEDRDRRLEVSGQLALDKFHPKTLDLTLAAHDWLLFGSPTFGPADAPRAAADFDIGVAVDLAAPTIGVDATVRSLALRSPDRQDRGHQPEVASLSGDIIYLDTASGPAGKLPVTPPVVAPAPRHRRSIDARIHIPKSIHLIQTPFDVLAHGELTVTVRDEGVKTRGGLTMESGTLNLFGRDHELVDGNLSFSDEHPEGWLALTFERRLPDVAMRELSKATGGARVSFSGSPTKPKTKLAGAANAAMLEVMAMYNAGRPVNLAKPGLPASTTITAPRGDQLFVLTFMASNLPHLLFLDRIAAWADPYQPSGTYGQIRNVEAEHYAADKHSRVRAVVRPPTPGRSNAELQWDRLWINNDRTAFGVGLRGGDRGGGGVGLVFEWSSDD